MPSNKQPSSSNKNVLVLRFSALGDVVLTLPAVDYLCASGLSVHVLTKEKFSSLYLSLKRDNLTVHIIANRASLFELISKVASLKKFQFRAIIDFHRNLRSRVVMLFCRLSAIGESPQYFSISKPRFREGVLFIFRNRIFGKIFREISPRWVQSLAIAFEALSSLGVAQTPNFDSVLAHSESQVYLRDLPPLPAKLEMGNKRLVALCVDSTWVEKQWAENRFIELAKKLVHDGFLVVWLGLSTGKRLASEVVGSVDLTMQLSVQDSASVLAKAAVLVCNDSGLMHIAEAVGTPVVGIFGPTSKSLGFAPRLRNSRITDSPLWCRPCSKTGRLCFRLTQKQLCLKMVSVEQVYNTARSVLSPELSDVRKSNTEDLEKGHS